MKEQLDNDRGFFENVNAKSKLIEADFDELEKSRQQASVPSFDNR